MRNYYLCNADHYIYTEVEMRRAVYPSGRFLPLGRYNSREEALLAYGEMPEAQDEPAWRSSRYVMAANGGHRA